MSVHEAVLVTCCDVVPSDVLFSRLWFPLPACYRTGAGRGDCALPSPSAGAREPAHRRRWAWLWLAARDSSADDHL